MVVGSRSIRVVPACGGTDGNVHAAITLQLVFSTLQPCLTNSIEAAAAASHKFYVNCLPVAFPPPPPQRRRRQHPTVRQD
ncbi:hypothetical protein BLOT_000341 [Blomia tropicalis]|nr:hypothetical protein BLOT_000341 [Blomia tropicalis]